MMSNLAIPARANKRFRRALELHRGGRIFDALPIYVELLEQFPKHPALLHYVALLGRQLYDRARHRKEASDAAVRLMLLAVEGSPDNAGAVHNLAKLHHDRGEIDAAKACYEAAVALDPAQGESWTNLGNVYGELGNRMRAESCWLRALECPIAASDAAYNLSFLRLLKGNYAEGWPLYEHRFQSPGFAVDYGRPDLTRPKWSGAPVRTLYVHQEQGAGDALMMARYIPLAEARADHVIVEVIPGLVSLFAATFPDLEIVARGDRPPSHDAQVSLLSMPAVFGSTLTDLPPPASFRAGIGSIGPEPGRIGLCWRGSPGHTNDRIRSMPFEALAPLLTTPGYAWQSLQFGYDVTAPVDGIPVDPCPAGDFLETARAIARCETVITVDTSIAHLAGSMGVDTWILLPFSAEWRWLQDREDSPWYPGTARLWRQARAGDWVALATRVAAELAHRAAL